MKNTEDHYMHMLDSHKLTGYMFKRIPMTPGTPIIFTLMNVLLFALIGKVTHLELLMAIPCFAIVWEHYNVSLNRNMVLEDCVVNEIYMQYEFVQNGVDPNFPDDPIYELDKITFKFYNPDNTLIEFDDNEHSFTLEITTIDNIPELTNINSTRSLVK
jgi:hypothetical protein